MAAKFEKKFRSYFGYDLFKILGDDDVLEDPIPCSASAEEQPQISRFVMRLWSWLHSKEKIDRPSKSRKKSMEFHTKRLFTTRSSDSMKRKEEVIMVSSGF